MDKLIEEIADAVVKKLEAKRLRIFRFPKLMNFIENLRQRWKKQH